MSTPKSVYSNPYADTAAYEPDSTATTSLLFTEDSPLNPEKKQKEFNPLFIVIIFVIIHLIIYIDRGILASCLDTIKKEFALEKKIYQGLLSSIFIIGYMSASPVFAFFASRVSPFRVIAIGLSVWAVAMFLCGIANNYWILFIGRLLSGVGEASFLCIAPPMLEKIAKPGTKAFYLACFYCAIPCGYALGFILAGVFIEISPSKYWLMFITEAALILPFLLFLFIYQSPVSFVDEPEEEFNSTELEVRLNYSQESINSTPQNKSSEVDFVTSVKVILSNKMFWLVVLGYAMQTYTTGCLSLFSIDYVKESLKLSAAVTGVGVGVVSCASGILGTMLGGILFDRLKSDAKVPSAIKIDEVELAASGKTMKDIERERNDMTNANNIKDRLVSLTLGSKILAFSTLVAFPFTLAAFVFVNPIAFFIFLFIAENLIFMCFSVVNSTIMGCVEFKYTPQALALSVIFMHLLGDSLSPVILGALYDSLNNYRYVMIITVFVLVPCFIFWFLSYVYIKNISKVIVEKYDYNDDPLFITNEVRDNFTQRHDIDQLEEQYKYDSELMSEFIRVRSIMNWDK